MSSRMATASRPRRRRALAVALALACAFAALAGADAAHLRALQGAEEAAAAGTQLRGAGVEADEEKQEGLETPSPEVGADDSDADEPLLKTTTVDDEEEEDTEEHVIESPIPEKAFSGDEVASKEAAAEAVTLTQAKGDADDDDYVADDADLTPYARHIPKSKAKAKTTSDSTEEEGASDATEMPEVVLASKPKAVAGDSDVGAKAGLFNEEARTKEDATKEVDEAKEENATSNMSENATSNVSENATTHVSENATSKVSSSSNEETKKEETDDKLTKAVSNATATVATLATENATQAEATKISTKNESKSETKHPDEHTKSKDGEPSSAPLATEGNLTHIVKPIANSTSATNLENASTVAQPLTQKNSTVGGAIKPSTPKVKSANSTEELPKGDTNDAGALDKVAETPSLPHNTSALSGDIVKQKGSAVTSSNKTTVPPTSSANSTVVPGQDAALKSSDMQSATAIPDLNKTTESSNVTSTGASPFSGKESGDEELLELETDLNEAGDTKNSEEDADQEETSGDSGAATEDGDAGLDLDLDADDVDANNADDADDVSNDANGDDVTDDVDATDDANDTDDVNGDANDADADLSDSDATTSKFDWDDNDSSDEFDKENKDKDDAESWLASKKEAYDEDDTSAHADPFADSKTRTDTDAYEDEDSNGAVAPPDPRGDLYEQDDFGGVAANSMSDKDWAESYPPFVSHHVRSESGKTFWAFLIMGGFGYFLYRCGLKLFALTNEDDEQSYSAVPTSDRSFDFGTRDRRRRDSGYSSSNGVPITPDVLRIN